MTLILTGAEPVIIKNNTFEVTIIDNDGMFRHIVKCNIIINNGTIYI